MNYIVDHISINTPRNRRPGFPMKPEYITIHSTGNPSSTAANERAWLTNPANQSTASWHICVDEKMAIEAIPLNEVAWHAGDGRGPGNMKSIGVEICESGDREKTLQNTILLVVMMLRERGWGVDRLKRHFDWSGKNCPRIMSPNNWQGWENFLARVGRELKSMTQKPQAQSSINAPSPWAKDAWEWAKRKGITDGTNPKGPVTREQVVTMIYRATGQ